MSNKMYRLVSEQGNFCVDMLICSHLLMQYQELLLFAVTLLTLALLAVTCMIVQPMLWDLHKAFQNICTHSESV